MILYVESKNKQKNKKPKLMDVEDRWVVVWGMGWGVDEMHEMDQKKNPEGEGDGGKQFYYLQQQWYLDTT